MDDAKEGVGAGGKWKGNASSSSSKSSKPTASKQSTKKLTAGDREWPKDLPVGVMMCMVTWNNMLREAMNQGPLELCWAVAITSCIEALLFIALKKRVLLSAQHLVNNIKNMDKTTGKLKKYNEVRDFLTTNGLPSEGTCPYTKKIGLDCPKSCLQSDEHRYKIKDLTYLKGKKFTETDVISLLQDGPVLAVIEAYESFRTYKDGIYEGRLNKKDMALGRHVVVVTGYDTTPEGINYLDYSEFVGH